MTTEVVTQNTAIAAFEDAEFDGYENFEEANVRAFINLANHANHLSWADGIKLGDMFNTLTSDIYTDPIQFIPCFIDKYVAEFTMENTFEGRHAIDGKEYADALDRAPRDDDGRIMYKEVKNEAGNKLQATHDVYALVSPDGGNTWFPGVVPMSSTKIQPYVRFFTTLNIRPRADGNKAKLFENICEMTTEKVTGSGNTYYKYKFKFLEHINDATLAVTVVAYAESSRADVESRKNGNI